jgi:hypothetical protein
MAGSASAPFDKLRTARSGNAAGGLGSAGDSALTDPVWWLWRDVLAEKKITVVAGAVGVGKSLLVAGDLAARLSVGAAMAGRIAGGSGRRPDRRRERRSGGYPRATPGSPERFDRGCRKQMMRTTPVTSDHEESSEVRFASQKSR